MSESDKPDDVIDVEPRIVNESEQPQPARSRNYLRWGGAGLLALAIAAVGGWAYRDLFARYFPSDQVTALSEKISVIEAASKDHEKRLTAEVALVEELKSKIGAAQAIADKSAKSNAELSGQVQAANATISNLQQALEATNGTLAEVQQKLHTLPAGTDPALAARLAQLEKDLNSKQVAVATPIAPSTPVFDKAAMIQSLTALKNKVSAGSAFAPELAAMQKAIPAAPGFEILRPAAAQGAPTIQALAADISTLAAALPKMKEEVPSGDSWYGKASDWLSGLVTVKVVGESDVALRASKAAAFAVAGDLEQSTSALAGGTEPLTADLQAWLAKAQARLKIDQALGGLSEAVAREIAAKG